MACWPCAGSVEPNAPRRRPAQEAARTPREAFALPRLEEADLGRQPFPFRERAGVRGVPGIQLSLTPSPLPLGEGRSSTGSKGYNCNFRIHASGVGLPRLAPMTSTADSANPESTTTVLRRTAEYRPRRSLSTC